MIIVSQDKEQIVNFNNIEILFLVKKEVWYQGVYGEGYQLAEYKTEERAKEVLQEIYKVYSDFSLIKCVNQKYQELLIANNKNEYFDVYEMPKE